MFCFFFRSVWTGEQSLHDWGYLWIQKPVIILFLPADESYSFCRQAIFKGQATFSRFKHMPMFSVFQDKLH